MNPLITSEKIEKIHHDLLLLFIRIFYWIMIDSKSWDRLDPISKITTEGLEKYQNDPLFHTVVQTAVTKVIAIFDEGLSGGER